MEKIDVSLACHPYDRVRALIDGTVRIEGCRSVFLPMRAEESFHRAYADAEFDISELSMSSYILTTALGTCPYIGIPVFISRVFRHSAIYVRSDRGIAAPADLRGKVIGVPEYQMTAALWVRGFLSDSYGVKAEDIHWRTGGLENPGRIEKFGLTFAPPLDVAKVPDDKSLSRMLAAGELDGLVSARAPSCFRDPSAGIVRLFPDYRKAEEEYFRQTGLFPIMHVIGVKRSLAERHSWLAASVFKAFIEAKAACLATMPDVGALEVTLPWLTSEIEATKEVMGEDYWPYGFEENRVVLEAMVRYSHEQGLSPRRIAVEELFAPSTLHRFKV